MGHFSKDCPTGGGNACRNCGEEGHQSKECDKPRNPATVTCRNCEEMGHFSKECPKPRDYSKVKCQNCGESKLFHLSFLRLTGLIPLAVGHTKVRCKQPAAEAEGGGFDNGGLGGDTPAAAGGDEWAPVAVEAPVITVGGGDSW